MRTHGWQVQATCHPPPCSLASVTPRAVPLPDSRTIGCLDEDALLRFCSNPAPPRPAGGPSSSAICVALNGCMIRASAGKWREQSAPGRVCGGRSKSLVRRCEAHTYSCCVLGMVLLARRDPGALHQGACDTPVHATSQSTQSLGYNSREHCSSIAPLGFLGCGPSHHSSFCGHRTARFSLGTDCGVDPRPSLHSPHGSHPSQPQRPTLSGAMFLTGAALPDGTRTAGGSHSQSLAAASIRRCHDKRAGRVMQPVRATISGDQRGPNPAVRRFPGSQAAPGTNLNGSVVGGSRTGALLPG